MIATSQKDFDQLYSNLKYEKNVVIIGCGLCAKTFQTGGEAEVEELTHKLEEKDINVLKASVIDAVCDQRQVRLFINRNSDAVSNTDSIIVLACGAGVQAFKEIVPEIKLHPYLDTMFLATEKRLGYFYQFCSMCGDCKLEITDGICVVTRCPKGFINGPCGGAKKGKCEAMPENKCVWNRIFEFNKENFRDKYINYISPKNYQKQFHPRKIEKKL